MTCVEFLSVKSHEGHVFLSLNEDWIKEMEILDKSLGKLHTVIKEYEDHLL